MLTFKRKIVPSSPSSRHAQSHDYEALLCKPLRKITLLMHPLAVVGCVFGPFAQL